MHKPVSSRWGRSSGLSTNLILLILLLAPGLSSVLADNPGVHLRINCGGPEVGNRGGASYWESDHKYAKGGSSYPFNGPHDTSHVKDPAPQTVYRTVRHLPHRFDFPELPDGVYRLRFHFTEGYPSDERKMDYTAEGKIVVDNLNIYRKAGGVNRALILEAEVTVGDGNGLQIAAQPDGNKAQPGNDVFAAGIEIIGRGASRGRGPSSDVALKVRQLTGAASRLVWARVENPEDVCVQGEGSYLMGLDTEDGKGVRRILGEQSGYSKPMLTPEGRVVFSNRSRNLCYLVNFDGSSLRELVSGFATDVWRDPQSGHQWLYVRGGDGGLEGPIVRYRLDDLSRKETVWDRTMTGHQMVPWFQLSGDGTRASDAFPWSQCGVANLVKGDWESHTGGCWPSMAPDNSYQSFVFLGNHKEIALFDGNGQQLRTIAVNAVPDKGGGKVYHPRWSRHPRFITVTAPQQSPETELFLGRFDGSLGRVESWVRITHDDQADYYGDALVGIR